MHDPLKVSTQASTQATGLPSRGTLGRLEVGIITPGVPLTAARAMSVSVFWINGSWSSASLRRHTVMFAGCCCQLGHLRGPLGRLVAPQTKLSSASHLTPDDQFKNTPR